MKKRIMAMALLLAMALVQTAFAAESPEQAASEYYEACATGDADAIIRTVDMEYVKAHLADEETYRMYIETAFGAADPTVFETSNMNFEIAEDNSAAMGSVDVKTEAVIAEDGSSASWQDTFMVYATNKGGDWKVALTMQKDLYVAKVEEAVLIQNLMLAQDIAEEEYERSEALYDEAGNPLVDPSEVDMEGAVVLPGESAGSGTASETSQAQDGEGFSSDDMEKAIAKTERKSGLAKVLGGLALLAAIGGGLMFVKKRK
ncbi:MAG: hypothetical protein C0604_04850 [Clostridiales bacterium]|nr:MAG: hypothetical protein C0604_04850 [Clostridiales bacterium]